MIEIERNNCDVRDSERVKEIAACLCCCFLPAICPCIVQQTFSALFGGLRGGTFTYSQSRIDRRIRDHLFRSLVKQEIGFFDENKTGTMILLDRCYYYIL